MSQKQHFGYGLEFGPDGQREEDIASCGHCQFQMVLPPPKDGQIVVRTGARCGGCQKFICAQCSAEIVKLGCVPWQKRMEMQESRDRMLKSIGVG